MKMLIKVATLSALLVASSLNGAEEVKIVDINAKASDATRITKEDLGNKKVVTELALGLRKTDLYSEEKDTAGDKADYSRPAPGSSTRFERAFVNAPPMIPHSVEGLLPITITNNQCVGCHMPAVAPSMKATPIPTSHFTNYRPTTVMDGDKVLKEGKEMGPENTSDILVAKAQKSEKLNNSRFNCSQCHAPQSKAGTAVANTFEGDFGDGKGKSGSSLADVMNEGVQ